MLKISKIYLVFSLVLYNWYKGFRTSDWLYSSWVSIYLRYAKRMKWTYFLIYSYILLCCWKWAKSVNELLTLPYNQCNISCTSGWLYTVCTVQYVKYLSKMKWTYFLSYIRVCCWKLFKLVKELPGFHITNIVIIALPVEFIPYIWDMRWSILIKLLENIFLHIL